MGLPRWGRLVATVLVAGTVVALPAGVAHAATEEPSTDGPGAAVGTAGPTPPPAQPTPSASTTPQASDEVTAVEAAGLALTLSPVVGDGAADGHLQPHRGTDVLSLTFSPSRPETQHAVVEVAVTNTGDVDLHGLTVHGDRLGTVTLDATDLPPGATATARAVVEVTGTEARTGLGGLLPLVATATASTPSDEVVTSDATLDIEVVAVLASLSAEASLAVVTGEGDVEVGQDGRPTVTWPDGEVAATRRVVLRLTVANTGDAALHDLRAVLDVLGSTGDVDVASVLGSGEEIVVDVVRELSRAEVLAAGATPPMTTEVVASARVDATDESDTRPVSLRGDTSLLALVGRDEVVLPAAGPPTRPELALVALLSIGLGAALLVAAPRPRLA